MNESISLQCRFQSHPPADKNSRMFQWEWGCDRTLQAWFPVALNQPGPLHK